MSSSLVNGFFFFFQAEDGIRDVAVTGVQTCALPISAHASRDEPVLSGDVSGAVASGDPGSTRTRGATATCTGGTAASGCSTTAPAAGMASAGRPPSTSNGTTPAS